MKLGVCVPYRNREAHLQEFIPQVGKYLEDQGIDYCMYFAHQKDEKLFNRGAMKNIAAKVAFEEGCDYIVWHDIDMIPEEGGGADYSYPEEFPVHIATNISQMDYKLKYFEYFGGAVVFTREQVEKTNGYSNEYWDWGSEDDDLFWRCYLEDLANVDIKGVDFDAKYFHFTGQDSYIKIENPLLTNWNCRSHTVQITCRAFQQPEKALTYLLGNPDRKYLEYPILCVPGYDYGINFNNSRALSLQFWNSFNQHNYMWAKKYDGQWSTVTAVFDASNSETRFYLNGQEIQSDLGQGSPSPIYWSGRLKRYGNLPIYLGTTPSVGREDPRKFFKGDIREVKIWSRDLNPYEVQQSFSNYPENLDDCLFYLLGTGESSYDYQKFNVEQKEEDICIVNSILPHRRTGRFRCLPHPDEGIVGGKFVKGQPSADNERRYVTKMQQGEINYKQDGIAQVKYELLGIEELTPRAKMINVRL